jgi:hypothetical protein
MKIVLHHKETVIPFLILHVKILNGLKASLLVSVGKQRSLQVAKNA